MRKFRQIAAVCLLAALATVLCACGGEQARLADLETVVYDHPTNGATLTLPSDWQKLSETEESAVFVNADNSLSMGLVRELAGFSYYSAEGLAGLAEELLASKLSDMEIIEREALSKPENAVLVTASGNTDDGAAVASAVVVSPLSAVRYFIVVTAESDAFAEQAQVLRDIYASFELNKTEDEIYEQIPEN